MKIILFELWGDELHESRSSQLDATFAIAKRKTELKTFRLVQDSNP